MANKANKPCKHRNPMFNHPLMKKGCVHGKTTKALRQKEKMELKREYPVIWALIESLNNRVFA